MVLAREADELTERTCIVTRRVLQPSQLVRFVRGPEGQVVPDLKRKLPGRGVWVSLNRKIVGQAVARKAFNRGFGETCEVPADLPERLGLLLRRETVAILPLARKAGHAIAGFDKIEEALRRGEVALLLHAREAAADGRRKLDRLAPPGAVISDFFGLDELDLAFGRSNVVHAAVRSGPMAEQLALAVQRNQMYEADPEPPNVE